MMFPITESEMSWLIITVPVRTPIQFAFGTGGCALDSNDVNSRQAIAMVENHRRESLDTVTEQA